MRVTAPYKPIVRPWGEVVTFDEVTASLRKTQLRLETMAHNNPDLEFNKTWNEAYTYVTRQIALCAMSFKRFPETLPSESGSKLADNPDVKPLTKSEEQESQ